MARHASRGRAGAAESPELRTRLLDAGRAVFADMGYSGTTIDLVLERASTSRATFYRYFRSKNDLYVELTRECLHDMNAVIDELGHIKPSATDTATVERVLQHYRELHARHGGVFRAWWERRARLEPEVQAQQRLSFSRFVERLTGLMMDTAVPSKVAPDVRAALLYLLVEGSYFAVASRWSRIDPDELAPTLATMLQRTYLGGEPGAGRGRLRLG
jgi:AcrR family transcriptional regulator